MTKTVFEKNMENTKKNIGISNLQLPKQEETI